MLGAVVCAVVLMAAAPSAFASPYTPRSPYIPDNPGHWKLVSQNEIGSHSTFPRDYQWVDDTTGQPTARYASAARLEKIVQQNLAMAGEATGRTLTDPNLEVDAATTASDEATGASLWDGLASAAGSVKSSALNFLEKTGEWAGVDSLSGAVLVGAQAVGAFDIGWQIGSGIADLIGLTDNGDANQVGQDFATSPSNVFTGGQNLNFCEPGEACGEDPSAGYQEAVDNLFGCSDVGACPSGDQGRGGPTTWVEVADPPGSTNSPQLGSGSTGWTNNCSGSLMVPYGGFYVSAINDVPPSLSPVFEFGGASSARGSNECDHFTNGVRDNIWWYNKVSFNGPVEVDCLPGPNQCPNGTQGPVTRTISKFPNPPSQAQVEQNVKNCLTSAADMACQGWNGTYCKLVGSGCEGIPPEHQTGPGLVTIPQPNGYEGFDQYQKDLTAAGITATPTEETLSDAEANTADAPDAVVTTEPAPGNSVSPDTTVTVEVNPSQLDASGGPPVDTPTPPGIKVPQPSTPCNVFPFGIPCWTANQVGQFVSTSPQAPNFSIGVPAIAGGGSLNVNLDHPFGADLSSIMAVVRIVLLVLSAIGLVLWLGSFALGGSTSGGGTADASENE